jgi:formylglycine-generating enzyme required for sulfatase activity
MLPAIKMTADQAHRCCAWLGGRLPSRREWDYAAGYPEHREAIGAGDVRVKHVHRRPVNEGSDVNPYGIRDMYGNGREFTRDLVDGRSLPCANIGRFDGIYLRSERWNVESPVTFESLKREQTKPLWHQFNGVPGAFTSFRVLIEVP